MAKPVRLTLYVDNDQLKRALGESERSVENFGRSIEKQQSPIQTATVAMGGFIAGLALGAVQNLEQMAVAAAKWLPKLGEEFDNVSDRIRVSVGNNPLLNGAINESFLNLLPNVASGMDDVGAVLTTLYQRLGITGPAAEMLAKQILDLSRITGSDLATNLDAITTAINLWGITSENAGGAIDYLFKASQASGVPLDELARQVQNNGAQLQLLGLSFEDAVSASAQLGKAGVSLDDLGTSFKKLIATAVKDGKPLGQVLDEYVAGIQDGSISMEQALEDLGTRGGSTFIALAQSGRLNFGEIRNQIATSTDSVAAAADATEDWPEKWQKTFNAIQVALKPFADGVFKTIGDIMDVLVVKDSEGNVTGLNLASAWDVIVAKWNEAWPKIEPVLNDIWQKIVAWFGSEETQQAIGTIGKTLGVALVQGILAGVKATATSPDFLGTFTSLLPFANPSSAGGAGLGWLFTRASGGPVESGMPYLVGEQGPEIMVPGRSGTVIPTAESMRALGSSRGGDTWNVTVNGVSDGRLAVMELQRQRRKQVFLAGSR